MLFDIPATALPTHKTFARFRLSASGGLGPTGSAKTGEVEDYTAAIGLAAPVLNPEPPLTPGISNKISWPSMFQANEYDVEYDTDSSFATPDGSSGWIRSLSYTFAGLVPGQTYYYRARARTETWPPIDSNMLQTTQAEFLANTLVDTLASSGEENDVILTRTNPQVDVVGGLGKTSYEPYGCRMNSYLVTSNTLLTEIEVYFRSTYTNDAIEFVVYEGGSTYEAPFTRVHSSFLTNKEQSRIPQFGQYCRAIVSGLLLSDWCLLLGNLLLLRRGSLGFAVLRKPHRYRVEKRISQPDGL